MGDVLRSEDRALDTLRSTGAVTTRQHYSNTSLTESSRKSSHVGSDDRHALRSGRPLAPARIHEDDARDHERAADESDRRRHLTQAEPGDQDREYRDEVQEADGARDV